MLSRLITVTPVVLCLAVLPAVARQSKDRPSDQPITARMTAPEAVDPGTPDTDLATETQSQPAAPAVAAPAVYNPDKEGSELTVDLGNKPDGKVVLLGKKNKRSITQTVAGLTPAQRSRAARVARDAMNYRGARYVWGGDGRRGVFDCSGFTQYLYAKKGIRLPHSAKMQYQMGSRVGLQELAEGDLVFFNTRGPISHVGMYIGGGQFIHAANPRRGVVTSSMNNSYYAKRFAGARRLTS